MSLTTKQNQLTSVREKKKFLLHPHSPCQYITGMGLNTNKNPSLINHKKVPIADTVVKNVLHVIQPGNAMPVVAKDGTRTNMQTILPWNVQSAIGLAPVKPAMGKVGFIFNFTNNINT